MASLPRRCCELCGSPLRSSNLVGICSTNNECKRVKMERTRHPDGKPAINTEPPSDPDGEIWKPAPDPYGSLYLVSNRGRVWSMHRHRGLKGDLLKPWIYGPDKAPYFAVTLYDSAGAKWPVAVHVLVMRVFAGEPLPGQEVRHLDGDACRNWWEPGNETETRARGGNLFYGSHLENVHDMVEHGRARGGGPSGSDHPNAKFTEDLVRRIRAEHAAGGVTMQVLADRHRVNVSTMYALLTRKTWKHVA